MIQVNADRSAVRWTVSQRSPASSLDARVVFLSRRIRIDNRAELIHELALGWRSDVETIFSRGWAKWKERLPEKLKGEFAFGVFDPRDKTLFIARDAFGEAPLFYLVDPGKIVVGDASRTVRALAGNNLPLDLRSCADFLNGGYGTRQSAFFKGLARLPAGCWARLRHDTAVKVTRYWDPAQFSKDDRWARDPASGVAHFREIFDQAVMARYEAGSSALLLSGGLDSSAILGSLMGQGVSPADVPCVIKTYYQTPDWRDRLPLASLKRRFGLTLHEIASDCHDPLQDMEMWLDVLDGPYLSYGHSVASNLLIETRQAGWNNLYSGHGGDEVVGYGVGRINELARQKRWIDVWREASGMAHLSGQSRLRIMRKYLTHYSRYRRLERRLLQLFPDHQIASERALGDDAEGLLGEWALAKEPAIHRSDHDDLMLQVEALEDPVQQLALETIGQSGAAVGITMQMPFYDRDLVELSLSLPSSLKLQRGMTRYVLRAAMAGRLPRQILSRQDKFDFSNAFVAGLVMHREKVLDLTQERKGQLLFTLINADRLRHVRNKLARTGTGIAREDAQFLWRCSVFAIWQDQLIKHPGRSAHEQRMGYS